MTPSTRARLIAALAFPLIVQNVSAARAAPIAAPAAATQRLPHISIEEMGPRGAPTVVLIPGLSSPAAVWAGIAPTLAQRRHVLIVQVNGFGGDDPGANLAPGLLDGIVADLDTYLTAHRIAHPDLIGHSMGGLVALMLAKAHPDVARRLMIVDSLPYIGDLFAPGATVAMVEPQARVMRDAMAARFDTSDPAAAAATANRLALKPESRATVTQWIGKADARVSAAAFYEDMTTDLRPAMAGIATPITLVYPTGDAASAAQAAALYHRAYAAAPHVTFVPVADSAHFVMLDQPAAFAAAVDAFLR